MDLLCFATSFTHQSFNVVLRPHALRPAFIEIYLCRIYFSRGLGLAKAWLGSHDDSHMFYDDSGGLMRTRDDSQWFMVIYGDPL